MKIVRHSEIRIRFSSDAVQAGRSAGHVAQDVLLNGSCPITAALTVRPSVNHSGSFRDSCFFRHIRGHFTEYLRGIHQTVRKKVRRQIQLLSQTPVYRRRSVFLSQALRSEDTRHSPAAAAPLPFFRIPPGDISSATESSGE